MNTDARRELHLLEALEQNGHVTQRGLAARLGMALGLTNIYLKRLVRKGYVKCVSLQSNRLLYLVTPTGLIAKTRLTYEYMEYSLQLYRETRLRFRREVTQRLQAHRSRVAIYGTGEAAELAYFCLKELGLEPVAVFGEAVGAKFFNMPVEPIAQFARVSFDALIVATLDDPQGLLARLEGLGITREKLVSLREPGGLAPAKPAGAEPQ